jgi:hypothetical protein
MIFYRINEMAAAGSTGAGSIAANPSAGGRDRHGEHEWRAGARDDRAQRNRDIITRQQLEKAKRLKAQKPKFRNFVSRLFSRNTSLGEAALDVAGITSQLKGLENKNNYDQRNTVTYGVEDDEGNLMKVTVKSEDAKSFENRLALELGEVENNKIYGFQNSGVSLAEVLYTLKDEFNIVDVEFPEIPSDIVYNADKASLGEQSPDPNGDPNADPSLGGDNPDQLGDDFGEPGNAPPMGAGGDDQGMDDPDAMGSDDMGAMDQGEDFVEDDGGDDFKSLFKELVQLMTAQAEKEKAVADAEAEKARALQAEYTSKAANHEVSRQEELIRMQAEVDQQKKKEKEAKKYADLAKYRVNKDRGSTGMNFEGFTSPLSAVLAEDAELDGDLDTESNVRKEMSMAKQKYAPLPTDDVDTKNYKQQAYQSVMNQLQDKLKQIRSKQLYDQKQRQAQLTTSRQQQQLSQQQAAQANNVGGPPSGLVNGINR